MGPWKMPSGLEAAAGRPRRGGEQPWVCREPGGATGCGKDRGRRGAASTDGSPEALQTGSGGCKWALSRGWARARS